MELLAAVITIERVQSLGIRLTFEHVIKGRDLGVYNANRQRSKAAFYLVINVNHFNIHRLPNDNVSHNLYLGTQIARGGLNIIKQHRKMKTILRAILQCTALLHRNSNSPNAIEQEGQERLTQSGNEQQKITQGEKSECLSNEPIS